MERKGGRGPERKTMRSDSGRGWALGRGGEERKDRENDWISGECWGGRRGRSGQDLSALVLKK